MILLIKTNDEKFAKESCQFLSEHDVKCDYVKEDKRTCLLILMNDDDLPKAKELLKEFYKDGADVYDIICDDKHITIMDVGFTEIIVAYPMVTIITLLCIIISSVQAFIPQEVFGVLHFNAGLIEQGEVWRIFTPAFMHGGFWHIAFNLVIFFYFARLIERYMGATRVLLLFIAATSLGNIAQYWLNDFQGNFLGLSGVVNATIGYTWILSKVKDGPEGFVIPKGIFAFTVLYIVLTIVLSANTANGCHVVGLLAGLLIGFVDYIAFTKGKIEFKKYD